MVLLLAFADCRDAIRLLAPTLGRSRQQRSNAWKLPAVRVNEGQINSKERVADHANNIAYLVLEE